MSKRSSKRKSGRSTIRASRDHARAVAPHAHAPELLAARAYPSAAELFAQSSAWRSYVSETLRALLAPAALAGAVGLAGCAGVGDTSSGVLTGDTTTIESSATLTPIGQPTVVTPPVSGGGDVVITPIPSVTLTPLPPGTRVIASPLPPPGRVTPLRHPPAISGGVGRPIGPPIQPATNPPMVRGEAPAILPAVEPPQPDGGMRHVEPIQPVQPQPHARPQPQPQPNPNPPAVPGGMGVIMPSNIPQS